MCSIVSIDGVSTHDMLCQSCQEGFAVLALTSLV